MEKRNFKTQVLVVLQLLVVGSLALSLQFCSHSKSLIEWSTWIWREENFKVIRGAMWRSATFRMGIKILVQFSDYQLSSWEKDDKDKMALHLCILVLVQCYLSLRDMVASTVETVLVFQRNCCHLAPSL